MPQLTALRSVNKLSHPANRIPVPNRSKYLSQQRQMELFRQIKAGGPGSRSATAEIINNYQNFVQGQANKFKNTGIAHEDLAQEGNIGLLKAIEGFDHEQGTAFMTYAYWPVRWQIQKYIENNGRTIRLPSQAQNDQRELRQLSAQIKRASGEYPTVKELAEITDLSTERISELLSIPNNQCVSANKPLYKNEDAGPSLLDRLTSRAPSQHDLVHEKILQERLAIYLKALEPREKTILEMRLKEEKTLQEVGDHLGYTRESIRRFEAQAIAQIKVFHELMQSIGPQNISNSRQLRMLYGWRQRIHKVVKLATKKVTGRPLKTSDILKAGKIDSSSFVRITKRDPEIKRIVVEAIDLSWQKLLSQAIAEAQKGLAKNEPLPLVKTASLAGIDSHTLLDVIEKRPHLLPEGTEFRKVLTKKEREAAVIKKLRKLQASVQSKNIPTPNTYTEVASALGIWLSTLRDWKNEFSQEVEPLLEELLKDAARGPKGRGLGRNVIERQNARLKKLMSAALAFQRSHPTELVPLSTMIKKTGIPETTLLRLIQDNEARIKKEGIEFRSSLRGSKKVAYVLARLAKLQEEIISDQIDPPKTKADLCKKLAVSRNTILNWERSSEEIRRAIADLIAVTRDAA